MSMGFSYSDRMNFRQQQSQENIPNKRPTSMTTVKHSAEEQCVIPVDFDSASKLCPED